jgi:hypothetical protein
MRWVFVNNLDIASNAKIRIPCLLGFFPCWQQLIATVAMPEQVQNGKEEQKKVSQR